MVGMETSPASSLDVIGEVGVAVAMEEQSHLTQVVVGVPPGEREGEEGVGERGGGKAGVRVSLVTEEEPAEVLRQVSLCNCQVVPILLETYEMISTQKCLKCHVSRIDVLLIRTLLCTIIS